MKKIIILILGVLVAIACYSQKTVQYDLYVNDSTIQYKYGEKEIIAINGQLPAPTLYSTEGVTGLINAHNFMNVETSIQCADVKAHFHGYRVWFTTYLYYRVRLN